MFEKSESANILLFTVVQAIFLLIDANLESGVPKRVAGAGHYGQWVNAFFDGAHLVQQQT